MLLDKSSWRRWVSDVFILDHNIFSYWETDLNAWREYGGRLHHVQGDRHFPGHNAIRSSILHVDHT